MIASTTDPRIDTNRIENLTEAKLDTVAPYNVAFDDPDRLAGLFLAYHAPIVTFCKQTHVYDAGAYSPISDHELETLVRRFIQAEAQADAISRADSRDPNGKSKPVEKVKVTRALVSEVIAAIGTETFLSDSTETPCWLDGSERQEELISFQNGLLDVQAYVEGSVDMRPASSEFFTLNSCPFNFDPSAQCPAWLKFLESVWGDDHESIACLQEWFGYCLTSDTSLQKLIAIIGPPRAGKGTIAKVLEGIVGKRNATWPSMRDFVGQFGLAKFVGKSVAIFGDSRIEGSSGDKAAITEKLLGISGGDAFDIDRKYKEPLTSVALKSRMMVLSNHISTLPDPSGALATRFVLLKCENTFLGREDPSLAAKLFAELPGVMMWSLEGLRTLRERGRLIQPESACELVGELQEMTSPILGFLRERCIFGPGEDDRQVSKKRLYDEYVEWALSTGRKPKNATHFGRDLKAMKHTTGISDFRPTVGGERVHSWRNVCIAPEGI